MNGVLYAVRAEILAPRRVRKLAVVKFTYVQVIKLPL
jgi:hypothetical protein